MSLTKNNTFHEFLLDGISQGGFHNDDIVAVMMPLLKEVLTFHEDNKVAPLDGVQHILITQDLLDIDEQFAHEPKNNIAAILAISADTSNAFEIVEETKMTTDIESSRIKSEDLSVQLDMNQPIKKPVYILGYRSYEQVLGHHDAMTDIFVLGLILGSLSTGLDLSEEDDFRTFIQHRKSLVNLNSKIHPAISNIILEMTELNRKKRSRDLNEVIEKLKNYRDYNPEKEIDITSLEGFKTQDISTRNKWILNRLKSRLFDISRRNRLLYFKASARFLNLTVSSVPTTLNYKHINPESLFIWNDDISSKVKNGKPIALSKYLRIEDNPYIPSTLDKIRSEATRDVNEYGFSQLRLIICSLNWYNLKEDSKEKINSPLILVPVEIKKKKGVKDQYTLEITSTEAEVNPVLVYWLRELYDIKLPDTIVLEDFDMEKLYQTIQDQIQLSNSGISIEYQNKPRLKLIHSLAKQTLSQFNRRLRRNKNMSRFKDFDYSYQRENFQPLGLKIYKEKIQPYSSALEFLINEDIKTSSFNLTGNEKERSLFTIAGESDANPFLWEFDTCNMTVGNLNYKKMSLVRDYNEIIDENVNDRIFEELFSDQPKGLKETLKSSNEKLEENYHIISCDPTQSNAVRYAKSGESYIIQGPPGTGKSQTITNLIADYIARGKRVLFVCEKRAAIDVVFFRLKQQKLDELCCRIHDSQADKKEFIMNLKETYHTFMKEPLNLKEVEAERNKILNVICQDLQWLERYNQTMQTAFDHVGVSILNLIERLVNLKHEPVQLSAEKSEQIPDYSTWKANEKLMQELIQQLKDSGLEPYLSEHPVSLLKNDLLTQEQPINTIKKLSEQLEELFEFINNTLTDAGVPDNLREKMTSIHELIQEAARLKDIAESENLFLLDAGHASSKQFEGMVFDYTQLKTKEADSRQKNQYWKNKFPEGDLKNAQELLQKYERSFMSFLNPGYWKLKKSIRSAYDFSKHAVKPPFKKVLDDLQDEYAHLTALSALDQKVSFTYRINNILETWEQIQTLRKNKTKQTVSYLGDETKRDVILELNKLKAQFDEAKKLVDELVHAYEDKNILDLMEDIENIRLSLSSLPELLPALNKLNQTDAKFQRLVKSERLSLSELEKLTALKSLNQVYIGNKEFQKAQYSDMKLAIGRLKFSLDKLYEINASFIRAKIRKSFNENLNHASKSVTGMNAEERELKKVYTEGRKILENEFNKSIRYKSIRELASKESGKVIQDLKPVWLMSPLSVSDTLPLTTNLFDVVIFDEASQITIEEGVPPLFRGRQTIIVGDEMQMPPSNFFGSVAPQDEDESGDDDTEGISIDADSLLTQGARKLKDVMLGWHYRSRYEALISFSNAAFYQRNLLTIPDQAVPATDLSEIVANETQDGIKNADFLFDRSISFHYLNQGLYEKRSNLPEADYIAQLVKTLIVKEHTYSIGVVAFSQEQQAEIESALIRLASEDKEFEVKLEEEYQRHEDGQFIGLFVKNLENVQGDERDIIIMSVCYGHDRNKRMIMNFGPINRKGGEKRLNVIFSRAKQHMAVVSSIKYSNIKNEYNEGANYFRKFLQYAESVSRGDMAGAKVTLDSLSKHHASSEEKDSERDITQDIAEALKKLGHQVDLNIGQSYFRCHIGIRDAADKNKYALGILLDTADHYNNTDLLEQYVMRPGVLKNFKWNVIQVFSKDWLHQPEKVLEQIKKALEGKEVEEKIVLPETKPESVEPAQEPDAPEVQPETTTTDPSGLTFKRLHFKDETSDKFWEVAQDGTRMIVRFGRTGTKGQENVKTFESDQKAAQEIEKLIRQKKSKGYN